MCCVRYTFKSSISKLRVIENFLMPFVHTRYGHILHAGYGNCAELLNEIVLNKRLTAFAIEYQVIPLPHSNLYAPFSKIVEWCLPPSSLIVALKCFSFLTRPILSLRWCLSLHTIIVQEIHEVGRAHAENYLSENPNVNEYLNEGFERLSLISLLFISNYFQFNYVTLSELDGKKRITCATMDLFQLDKLVETNILFSTIVAGPFCIGHLLRLCCEAEQDILFMVFIDYLGKDFGLSSGQLRDMDIQFFLFPFKLAKCDGTKKLNTLFSFSFSNEILLLILFVCVCVCVF